MWTICRPSPAEGASASAEGQAAKSRISVQPDFQAAWHAPAQVVLADVQISQVEAAQLRRYLPAQLVVVELQSFQVGEAAQLRRYLPAQLVAAEDQPFQIGEADQLRRQLPAQLVVAEAQLYNAPVVVGGDAPPFAERRVAQPVVVIPVLTVRCVVEGNQGFPVRIGGAGGRGRRCRSRRCRRIGGGGRGP